MITQRPSDQGDAIIAKAKKALVLCRDGAVHDGIIYSRF